MYRGSTPTFPFKICGKDLTGAKLFITIRDDKTGNLQTVTSDEERLSFSFDGTDTVGEVTLTQEETLAINAGSARVQIRYIYPNGKAGVTQTEAISVKDVLLKEVISYGE